MNHWLDRTTLLLGQEGMDKLSRAKVAVLGLGGVGGAAAEALCRSGVGSLLLMDHDTVDLTNLNRQLFATTQTLGMDKCQAARERLLSIAPECQITTLSQFYSPGNREPLFSFQPDYVVDAIDTVTSKLDLAEECQRRGVPLIMSMGTGNRLDPSQFRVGTIEETAGCGCALARVIRRELRRRGVERQMVVYSTELPRKVVADSSNGRHSPGSSAFCPPVAGYLLASHVVCHLAR